MKNLRVKLFDLDSLKSDSRSECRKTPSSYSVKRFSKAIIFKDCELRQGNPNNISKMQKINESFKISAFNLSEHKTYQPLNITQHTLGDSMNSTALARTKIIERRVKNRFRLTPNIFLKRNKLSEKKIASNTSKDALISPIFITKLTKSNAISERLLKTKKNDHIICILHKN